MFKYKKNNIVVLTANDAFAGAGIFETVLMIKCLYPVILNSVPTTYNIKDTLRLLIPQC